MTDKPLTADVTASEGDDEVVGRVADSTGTQVDPARDETYDSTYTSIDLNTAATTTVFDASSEAKVYSVHLQNGGSTADVRLEVTDGTNTAVLADPAAGESIHFTGDIALGSDDDLQVVVETAEGSSLTGTAVVGAGTK